MSSLCVLPIVVGSDDGTSWRRVFERWIGQWIGDARSRKRRSDRTDHQEVVEQRTAADNEAGDKNVVTALNEGARADI